MILRRDACGDVVGVDVDARPGVDCGDLPGHDHGAGVGGVVGDEVDSLYYALRGRELDEAGFDDVRIRGGLALTWRPASGGSRARSPGAS
jgi:hypothetical protein